MLTDNEIIKALECCVEEDCRVCRYDVNSAICIFNLMKDTLDLINRQKAEIERLEQKIQLACSFIPVRGNGKILTSIGELEKLFDNIRAEAIGYALEWLQANHYINHSPERRKELVKEMEEK